MPTKTFTTRGLNAIKPTRNQIVDYWSADPKEPGFGLRVRPSGVKSWVLYTRETATGKPAMVTLGRFPKMKLAEARKELAAKRADVKRGENPADAHRAERQTQRRTLDALFTAYSEHVALKRESGKFKAWPEIKRSLQRNVIDEWGNRPVAEISRIDVADLIDRKAQTAPVAANRLLAHLSMLFAYAIKRKGWIVANPASHQDKSAENPRERILSADEITDLWGYLTGDATLKLSRGKPGERVIEMPVETGQALKDLFRFMLLTGQRLGETSKMKWADVDTDAHVWTVPAEDAKNGIAHRVPLSPHAEAILDTRSAAAPPSAVFVFPSAAAGTSSAFVWSKRTASAIARGTGIAFRAHDLRRTLASGLGELGVSLDVIGLVLNHKKPGVTGRHYDLSKREAAKRDALQRWAAHVEALVEGKAAKVVPIRGRSA